VPSGSCAGMLKQHYPELFAEGSPEGERARELAARTYELVSFLTDVMGVIGVDAEFPARATYHDACAGLRELGIKQQPRLLLQSVRGLELIELPDAEVCCGFGGTFCVKYPEISTRMVDGKAAEVAATGADVVLAGDLGCLMNIAGRLSRLGSPIEVRHVAEVLAGTAGQPPIGGREA
jgi:L-lactate dehydrogenase complex protein LldE